MQIAEQLSTSLGGHYAIQHEIGEGGMAVVYLARDLRHERLVAIKVLKPELGLVLGVERFLSEIRITANLQHPNLLPLFDSGEVGGLLFYVMPYVEGESLRTKLRRERQLPVDEAVHIATAVAAALEYAHSHGIVHRDLKPENILLQGDEPMVSDFGIALAVTRAAGERITGSGISLGTPQYMSPEQAAADHAVDRRSDIYSLAAVLYEMLAGEPPHNGPTARAVLTKVATEAAPSVRIARPSTPEHVARAIARGLEKVAADRWQTARDFADALSARPHLRAVDRDSVVSSRHARTLSSRALLVAAAVCIAAGTLLGSSVATLRKSESEQGRGWFDLALPDSALPQSETRAAPFATSIAVSPDGSTIVYVGGVARALYVRALDDLLPRRLAGTSDAHCPSFSPDGRWIVFVSSYKLLKIPASGGASITVSDSAEDCAVWTDRNEILFVRNNALYLMPAIGGRATEVVHPDSAKRIGAMLPSQALPGGSAALISVSNVPGLLDWQLGVVSLPDGRIRKLESSGPGIRYRPQYSRGYLVFGQNNGIVAAPFSLRTRRFTGPAVPLIRDTVTDFSASASGTLAYIAGRTTLSLVAVNERGEARTLAGGGKAPAGSDAAVSPLDTAYYSWPRLSPDGRRVALELKTGIRSWDIWVYDIRARILTRLTDNFTGVRPEGWTADSRSVIYMMLDSSHFNGPSRLVSQPWDRSAPPRELLRLPSFFDITLADPHGYAVFDQALQTDDIWSVPLDTPGKSRPFLATRATEVQPRLSPDGKLLAYVSDESGRLELYVRSMSADSARRQVSLGSGTEPAWSADGRQLYYRTGSCLCYNQIPTDGPQYVMRASIARVPELWVTARDTLFRDVFARKNVTNYAILPGGKELLMIRENLTSLHAAVVLDWDRLVRQQTGAP